MNKRKKYSERTATANELREQLQLEINKNKLFIDKSIFQKTPEEKEALRKAKSEYKFTQFENSL